MNRCRCCDRSKVIRGLLAVWVGVCVVGVCVGADDARVSLITDPSPGLGTKHGLEKVEVALREQGVRHARVSKLKAASGQTWIVAGIATGSGPAAGLLEALKISGPTVAESLRIRHVDWEGHQVLLVTGADDRGLMYALLDVADRIGWTSDPKHPLSEVHDTEEKPFVSERALSIYTMHRAYFESRFYDEKFWTGYLDMLARDRFNTFVLIFGYAPAAYLAPPYPYFFNVAEFPEVHVEGLTEEQQARNLKTLNKIIQMTHDRGLNFTLGIWDHIPRGTGPDLPVGLSRDKLLPYTRLALAKFLKSVPDIDALQFRMHGESGLKKDEMEQFWPSVYEVINECRPGIRLDARAKAFPDSLIYKALDMGVNLRMCTKYWMEQMGMPWHPTHIHPRNQHDRRHGYADMLRYPKRYAMHWKLWNAGSNKALLWADPDFVRRFAENSHLYDGEGFEVNEPSATKMALHTEEAPIDFLTPKYRFYDHEYERFWHFFQVFGRLSYNPETSPVVWQKEFERRFGAEAALFIERGLHRASQIVPRVIGYSYPYNHFPTLSGWPEKQRQEDLPVYAKALPSDTQQFLSMEQAATNLVKGQESAKVLPRESSQWFAQAATDVLGLVAQAERHIGNRRSKEFLTTMTDLRILAHLAEYHSQRALAGVRWALFKQTDDLNALDDAVQFETQAVHAWERLVQAAGDVYQENLMIGRDSGHWKDELVKLKDGLDKLKKLRKDFQPTGTKPTPTIAHVPTRRATPGQSLVLRATASGQKPIAEVRVGYGGGANSIRFSEMTRTEPFLYRAVIPGAQVRAGFRYFIEAVDETGRRASWPEGGQDDAISVTVTDDNDAPTLVHKPIKTAPAEKPLQVTAQVSDPSGVKWVRLRYRSVNQHQDYQTLEMRRTHKKDEYRAVVPAEHVVSQWDFMYLLEVMDNAGNGKIYPDLETETPYVVVKLRRDTAR